jgi:heme exporter protein C
MATEMWLPLLVMVIGFYCFFAVSLMMRTRNEILVRERRSSWVKELVGKQ